MSYLILRQIALVETRTMSRRLDQTIKSLVDDLGIATDASDPASTGRKHFSERMRGNVDLEIILDRNGKPLPSKLWNSQAAQLPAPALQAVLAELPTEWVGLPTVEPLRLPKDSQVGLLQSSEGLLLLSERLLLQKNRLPLRLVTGQWLRSARLQELGDRTLLILHLLPVDDPEVPVQLRKHQSGNLRAIEDYIPKSDQEISSSVKQRFPKGTEFLAGYALFQDVTGKPIAVLQAISPKPFAVQGEEGVKFLLIFLWVTVLIFSLALNLLLDRWVLVRIDRLSRQLKQVKADCNYPTQISLPGRDELSDLAADINAMLQRQERYQENLRLAKADIEAANRELERLACTDGLTQVMNRRFFQIHLDEIWQQALQTTQPLSLLLCDVDFFKLYNDTYGHLAGDLCLQKVARAMSAILESEPAAIIARYGGEEFAALLANQPIGKVVALAEQMRAAVLHLKIPHSGSKIADCVTLSIGVCSLVPQPNLSYRDLIAQADEHLYRAKSEGRNRVIAALPTISYWQNADKQAEAG
jgi:diguanylate cyclase (GGDEF)-like protein